MSIFNSALFVISEVYADEYVKQHMTPLEVTKALSKAGLLMPDLPEPDGHDADGLPYWGEGDYNTALTWHPCDRDVPRNERPLLIHSLISPWMHPDELESEALRALAAARAARQAMEEADAAD